MNVSLKKMTAVVTAGMMVSTLFVSGCADKKQAGTDGTKAESTAAQEGLVNNTFKTGLPIVKDKINVKIVTAISSYNKVPFADMECTKKFEKDTNIHVEFQEITNEMREEKVNIMLASGDIPDGFMRALTTNQLVNNYTSNLFLPLNDFISKYAPTIQSFFEDASVKSQLTFPDGKIYSTPAGEVSPWLRTQSHLYIQKDWLSKLGLKVPTTTQEFSDALLAMKGKDLDGDGKIGNEVPFSFAGADNLRYMLGSFGVACDDRYLMVKNGKVSYAPTSENFKKAMQYFNTLWKAGVVDTEGFSQSSTQFRAKGKNGVLGSFNQMLASSTVGNDKMNSYADVAPLKGPDGFQETIHRIYPVSHGLVLSAKTKYPEALVRWVDYLNTGWNRQEMWMGLESQGVWTKLPGDKYECNSHKTPQGLGWTEWQSNTAWYDSAPEFFPTEYVMKQRVLDHDEVTKGARDRTELYMKYAVKEVMPVTVTDPNVNQEINTIHSELNTLVRNYVAKSVIEGVNDTEWKSFQDNLKKARYEKFVELNQRIYDDYLKTKK